MKRVHSIAAVVWLTAIAAPVVYGQHTTSAAIDAMPGLALRMKASTLGLADGDPVLVWANTADASRSATAAGSPVFVENQVNGKACVRFAKSHLDLMSIGGGGLSLSDWTVFIVHRTTGDCCFLGNADINYQLRIGESGVNQLNGWDNTGRNPVSNSLAAPRGSWNAIEFRRDKSVLAFLEAGTSRGHGEWDENPTFNQIGSILGNPSLDGDIAEFLIFARKLSIGEEVKVYDYIYGEYGIVPSIVPTAIVRPAPALPRLYSYLHFQNAANINFRALPIDRTHVYAFFEAEVNPNLATFQAAVDARIPDVNATGYASLDLEVASPGLLPWYARDYAYAPWTTIDREYIIGLLTYARAARPGVKWGVYWHPYYDTLALRSDYYPYYSTTLEWFEAYTGPGGLATLLGYCDTLQPEIYPKDRTETQDQSNFVAAENVKLCHDINDFYVTPQVAREVYPLMWVQVVPYAIGGGSPGDFLTVDELTQRFIALRLSGADGAFIGGGADPWFYTPDQWQQWADTTLTQALIAAGYVCYANCDGSTTPPVLNVNDFGCFLNRFASGDPLANCDGSTTPPLLNINDFACFLNKFAAGCP